MGGLLGSLISVQLCNLIQKEQEAPTEFEWNIHHSTLNQVVPKKVLSPPLGRPLGGPELHRHKDDEETFSRKPWKKLSVKRCYNMSSTEGQVALCQKCGVTGFDELLIYCNLCHVAAEHWYCLDKVPKIDDDVTWSCEDCVPTTSRKLSLQPIQEGEHRKEKQPQEIPNVDDALKKMLLNLSMDYQNSTGGIQITNPVWRGFFNIHNQEFGTIAAHISSKACSKVWDAATTMPRLIHLELLPRDDVWPERFSTSAPTVSDIALYFFEERDSNILDDLVIEMTDMDLALKAVLDNVELLIYPSDQLPLPYWRFREKYYLWGVYKGKPLQIPRQ